MRPPKTEDDGSGGLFRARLDQIIDMGHELVRLADEIDRDWIDGELADRFSDAGRPGTASRFMVGLLLLKHIYGLSDEAVCARWAENPYFQYFTGETSFRHRFPHERSGLTHRRQAGTAALREPAGRKWREWVEQLRAIAAANARKLPWLPMIVEVSYLEKPRSESRVDNLSEAHKI
jgi:hypothetical protein